MRKFKPVLAFPHHDPKGIYNKIFLKNLPLLNETFSSICISATPTTVKENRAFLNLLEKKGCIIFRNRHRSSFGDHFRNALKASADVDGKRHVFFGFIDRILFALETEHREQFIKDISRQPKNDMVIFSRSKSAWSTHPKDYFRIENLVAEAGEIVYKKRFDWIWCGALISRNLAKIMMKKSKSESFSVLAEFATLAFRFSKTSVLNKHVDWLTWEDPFWAKMNKVKVSKKMSEEEKKFRLNYCAEAIKIISMNMEE